MSEQTQTQTKEAKPKAFFARQYQFGKKKVAFHLRMMRIAERNEVNQKFLNVDNALSPIEKEESENDICLEILVGFSETREAGEDLKKAFASMTTEDGWILRDVWADYQVAHRPTVSFL